MSTYDASAIAVLKGLEPIQKRPDMYTRTESPTHLLQEVIDNACDEAQNGHARNVTVTLHADGSATVEDDGRGIPVDMHPSEGVPAVQVIFTVPHSGGKFDDGSYKISGGLHGIGVTVSNALSRRLEVEVRRSGQRHYMAFEHGAVVEPLHELGTVGQRNTGTRVRLWPEARYFYHPAIRRADIQHLLQARSAMLPGVRMRLIDEASGDTLEWHYPGGLADYLAERLPGEGFVSPIFAGERFVTGNDAGYADGEGAAWALAWAEAGGEGESFVNLIPTPQGGTHEAGLRAGAFESVKEFASHHGLMPAKLTLQAEDVWRHCRFVLAARIKEPRFQGQTKDRLNNREAMKLIASRVKDPLDAWLNAHVEAARQIAELAIRSATARARAGKVFEKKKASGVAVLPGKLTDCETSDPARAEVFLVEGDSAGGSAKQGRNRETQAILPLRGKVLNTWEIDRQAIFANTEVHDIAVALGIDPHEPDAPDSVLDGLRYHTVAIMADADVDGAHIQTLLLTLFLRHFPRLVARGHVYIAQPPLYGIKVAAHKGRPERRLYALDEAERDEMLAQLADEGIPEAKIHVGRFKGLGEMNPEQLRETTMHPDTRRFLRVYLPDEHDAVARLFAMLMGKGAAAERRAWMEAKGDQAEVDA